MLIVLLLLLNFDCLFGVSGSLKTITRSVIIMNTTGKRKTYPLSSLNKNGNPMVANKAVNQFVKLNKNVGRLRDFLTKKSLTSIDGIEPKMK